MSTGYSCTFVRTKGDEWFYAIEDGWGPKNAFDWRDFAVSFGPFKTEDEAINHMQANHANPGSWYTNDNAENKDLDATWDKLIAQARQRMEEDRKALAFSRRRW